MKWSRKKEKAVRYADVFAKMENVINVRAQKLAKRLQIRSDKLSTRRKYILFMCFCIAISTLCAYIIFNALK